MRITILEAGRPPEPLRAEWPSYPAMFERLLAGHGFTFEAVAAVDGAALPDPAACEGVLITGSPAGVYDGHGWIAPLEEFVRQAAAAGVAQVGICFGHQLMAQAFGGVVEKSGKGWGIGRHAYAVAATEPWMAPAAGAFSLAASHQDQVITPPPGARVLAHNPHTDYAALSYPEANAISFQGHPEMSAAFTKALIESRRGARIPEALADQAVESLRAPLDSALVAAWMAGFFKAARG